MILSRKAKKRFAKTANCTKKRSSTLPHDATMRSDQAEGVLTSTLNLWKWIMALETPVTMATLGKAIMTLVEVSGVALVVPASTFSIAERPDGQAEHSRLY